MQYLDLEVKTARIFHGFDSNNRPVEEEVSEDTFMRKLISVSRIRSISEQYILVTGADGREMYWEYKGSLEELKQRLQNAGIVVA